MKGANWVVKNDADLDRKQGEHLVETDAQKLSEQMIMSWSKQDLLDYMMSRSTGKWAQENKESALRLIIDPLFAAFPNEIENDRIKFPYQSGVLIGKIRQSEVARTGQADGLAGVQNNIDRGKSV
jgi:hypothetical protein